MTTRAPGLTAAMRRALEGIRDAGTYVDGTSICVQDRAYNYGFVQIMEPGIYELTPRGQAALAAPRMTAAELAMLERIAGGNLLPVTAAISVIRGWRLTRSRLQRRGFIAFVGGTHATPAGLTALNNMRAAMGSAEYKETA